MRRDIQTNNRLASTTDLLPSERRFLTAMHQLGYGRFESLRINRGELVLDPWPATVQRVNLEGGRATPPSPSSTFELKSQLIKFFAHVRGVDAGEIRTLTVQNGLPVSMELGRWTSGPELERRETAK